MSAPVRAWFLIGLTIALALTVAAKTHGQALAELPRTFIDTTYTRPTGRTMTVAAGGNFQAALDAAVPGDTITLQAGAVFVGPFTLPMKIGAGWIVVRSSASDASLPAEGMRITPAYSGVLPKIEAPAWEPALQTTAGAHHFRFIGIEFRPTSGKYTYNLITLGTDTETNQTGLPSDIIFDRCYLHGDSQSGTRRGIAMNARRVAVIDSYLSDFKESGADSQAIAAWNSPGPFKIVNNYLEGAGENLIFGGSDPTIPQAVPSDIEVRRNTFAKPSSWNPYDPTYAGRYWVVKNLLELKNARRVLIEGNALENSWVSGQVGFAVLLTPRNQDGTAPWSTVEDVTFVNNVVRHAAAGISLLGRDYNHPSGQLSRVVIRNNLFVDIGGPRFGGSAPLFQILDGPADLTIEHNTAMQSANIISAGGAASTGVIFRDNITAHNDYGLFGDDVGFGRPAITRYFPNGLVAGNVMVGGPSSVYPAGNFFPLTWADVGFTDMSHGDYRLGQQSPYRGAATDGKDIGVDVDALNAALSGSSAARPPSALPSVPSAPSLPSEPALGVGIVSPANSSTVSGVVDVRVSVSGSDAVKLTYRVDGVTTGVFAPAVLTFAWDSTTVRDGRHKLTVVVWDSSGRSASATMMVNARNSRKHAPRLPRNKRLQTLDLGATTTVASIDDARLRDRKQLVYRATEP